LRLISVARQSWTVVGGELAFRRIDAGLVSLAAWLDAVHLIILKGMDAKDVVMFASRLEAPPPGVEVAEPVMDAGAFMAMG
jgi:hypothetical protein